MKHLSIGLVLTAVALVSFADVAVAGEGGTQITTFQAVPNGFIPNEPYSQTRGGPVRDQDVNAFLHFPGGRLLFAPDGISVGLFSRSQKMGDLRDDAFPAAASGEVDGQGLLSARGGFSGKVSVVDVRFGGNRSRHAIEMAAPALEEPMPWKANFFVGPRQEWRTGVPTYRKLKYQNVWEGVDLECSATLSRLEIRCVVHPGGDLAAVVMETGAEAPLPDAADGITFRVGDMGLRISRPSAWQERNGRRLDLDSRLRVSPACTIGYEVSTYDPDKELVIETTLSWSTFLGGQNIDRGYGICVDRAGSVYVTGSTLGDFPTTAGAFDTSIWNGDVFVTKFNPGGTALEYSTFIGGTSGEEGWDLEVDAAGCAYVVGETHSFDFPVTDGVYDTAIGSEHGFGIQDGFVTKLNPTGSALEYSTYIGGSLSDFFSGMAMDSAGNVFVTGYTDSTDFPTTEGAFDRTSTAELSGYKSDTFVLKLNASGTALVYSTYLEGNDWDEARDIAVDILGQAYVVGETRSVNFPTTPGSFDTSMTGIGDIFITGLNPEGSGLIFSTFLGGTRLERGFDIAVDRFGCVYVAGDFTGADFPVTPGALVSTINTVSNVFVTKLNPTGSFLVYSAQFGGDTIDIASCLSVDAWGFAYVSGKTKSLNFPVTADAYDTTFNYPGPFYYDVFLVMLNPLGSELTYSTYLGGSWDDECWDIFLDRAGYVYLTGRTFSDNFPTTPGSFDRSLTMHAEDVFVTRFDLAPSGDLDRSGIVDATDLVQLAGYMAGNLPLSSESVRQGDLEFNGNLNAIDLLLLLRKVTG